MATQLRVASNQEADEVSQLIFYAYKEFAYLICNSEDESTVLSRMKQLALNEKPLPISIHNFHAMVGDHGEIVGGFAAYPIIQTLYLYQNLYKALLEYKFFAALDTKVKLSPRLMNILGKDTEWQLPYADAFYLDAFAIHSRFRGQGLAPVMMEYVKACAIEKGCTSVVLLAREDMVSFYSRLGFHTNQFLDSGEEDFFVMHTII
ncbi:GNAT family N-acetyltransferase [Entomospira nematocerorum]|uniref:GNAT family N-acetyltransferase n=1 Tax=Entomospira nematocerorum TaxID=2719987 RepID=A0A968GBR0_9SPIO|nr:GNAT family N-acetyltransferase [Entomospira nematocera]NIZ46859.1 GNAT family N-acetyltransferase [Entomospira nematocera]WDI33342.1 GNAT family N-acetyltransferase [Entomospira nematocera]